MTITTNGKQRTVDHNITVAELLHGLRLSAECVVIEYNGEPLPRERFAATRLRPNDALEIAQMVGGG